MDIQDYRQQLEQIREDVDNKLSKLSQIDKAIKEQEEHFKQTFTIPDKLKNLVEVNNFATFFKKPYTTIPQGKNKILVVVPKFIKGFQVGWLWKDTGSYYIYQLDQYSSWLGDVPPELLSEINFKKQMEGTIQDDILFFDPSQKDIIKKKLGTHLKEISENQARIIRGHVFEVIAEMIENGCLPFKPNKVIKDDLKSISSSIKLREYQKIALDRFLETGAIGVFHPTGAGKSFIALHLLEILKGNKIIIVPTKTLAEQWNYYIDTYIPAAKNEIKISTYQGYRYDEEEYILTVYDECQRLPADTFSRLAVIKTKYRIGLSASPHREDGRESYIFALTGFPVGLNWRDYMETVGRTYHPVFIHVVHSITGKLSKLATLLNSNKKTFIFCDTIELGKKIASTYNIPYIYGETSNRLKEVSDNKVLVVSRVMDLGVSIKNLERIIEVDFLFGSRQQEIQRTGRLMHSEIPNVRHDIIMTEQEISSYGKRLWALQEKGFTIKITGG